nr:hypothetical protein CPGR_02739 [Mycolicibacterium malmesburyense]
MVGRQDQGRRSAHREPHHRIAGRPHAFVGGQPDRKLLAQEGFPLVGVGAAVADRGCIPVGVEARLAPDGHHHRDSGAVEPVEGLGVDVPSVEVVAGLHAVEQIQRGGIGAGGEEFDAYGPVHRRRRHLQVFDRQVRTRKALCERARGPGDEGRQQGDGRRRGTPSRHPAQRRPIHTRHRRPPSHRRSSERTIRRETTITRGFHNTGSAVGSAARGPESHDVLDEWRSGGPDGRAPRPASTHRARAPLQVSSLLCLH